MNFCSHLAKRTEHYWIYSCRFYTFKPTWPWSGLRKTLLLSPKGVERGKWLHSHLLTQRSLVCKIIAKFKGLHLIIIALLWCILQGRKNGLNCSSEVALVCVHVRFSVIPRVTEIICFPFSPTVLIDDHSLFHADTQLLSRVHYSKTLTPGKRGRLMGKYHSLHALHKVTARKRKTTFIMKTLLSCVWTEWINFNQWSCVVSLSFLLFFSFSVKTIFQNLTPKCYKYKKVICDGFVSTLKLAILLLIFIRKNKQWRTSSQRYSEHYGRHK